MNKAKKVEESEKHLIQNKLISLFRKKLLTWYAKNGRCFSWRKSSVSKYQLIISELLLQRTRAETVDSFFSSFISHFPSWKKLSNANESEISKIIKPIGLWKRRASTLKRLATIMAKKNGRFPKRKADIEALPGVGQYIANAILLLCHGEAQPLLDVNMARVLERVFGPRKLADIRYDPYLQELASRAIKCKEAKKLNWAILDLAALHCLSRKKRCNDCPLKTICSDAQKNSIPKGNGISPHGETKTSLDLRRNG